MQYGNYSSKHSGKRGIVKKILRSPIAMILALILFVILARAAWGIHDKAVLSATKLSQAQNEYSKLQARQADLTAQVARLSTDDGVDAEIRTKYKGVKTGESLAVIVDSTNGTNTAAAEASSTASVGWFARLLQKIGL